MRLYAIRDLHLHDQSVLNAPGQPHDRVWTAFAKYSYKQLKWVLTKKPEMRDVYVRGELYAEYLKVIDDVDATFDEFLKNDIVVING